MKKIFMSTVLIIVVLVTSLLSYAENASIKEDVKAISLEQAIEEGIKNSAQLKISDLDIQVKKIELSEARSQEKKYQKSDFSLGTVDGFQLDANMLSKKAEFALDEEQIKKEYVIEDIKYNVIRAYYGAIQAIDYVNITESQLKNIKKNRDIIQRKFDLGVVSKSDLLIADIALNEGNVNMEKARQDAQMALRALNMALSYPLDTKLKLTSTFKEEGFNADLNKDIEKSYEKRFDMIQLQNNYELVKLDFDTNSIVYTPNTYKYKYKESNVAKMENLLYDSKTNIEFDIRGKYDAIKSAEIQIELSKANVEKAKEGLRLKEVAYEVEMSTALEVKEAIVQIYNAELAVSNSISNYNLAVLEYNKAVNLGVVR